MEKDRPLEIERKYLIRRPSAETISSLDITDVTDIIQVYLTDRGPGISRRIRRRGSELAGYTFYYTEKEHVTSSVRVEREKIITQEEYSELIKSADPSRRPIEKTRYCFMFEGRMYEMDIFPFSDDYAFLEIEMNDPMDIPKVLPPLDIIRDVTDDGRYTNKAVAKTGVIEE